MRMFLVNFWLILGANTTDENKKKKNKKRSLEDHEFCFFPFQIFLHHCYFMLNKQYNHSKIIYLTGTRASIKFLS